MYGTNYWWDSSLFIKVVLLSLGRKKTINGNKIRALFQNSKPKVKLERTEKLERAPHLSSPLLFSGLMRCVRVSARVNQRASEGRRGVRAQTLWLADTELERNGERCAPLRVPDTAQHMQVSAHGVSGEEFQSKVRYSRDFLKGSISENIHIDF